MRRLWPMLLLSCGPDPSPGGPGLTTTTPPATTALELPVVADDSVLIPLDAPRLLRRMSLDLRGHLPSIAELDAVEADPGALSALRDGFLEDPAFEERMVVLLAERWFTRTDSYIIFYTEYPWLRAEDEYVWERSVGEEPLRLLAHIAAGDGPWTEIVTADYTVANELLAPIWPLDYPEGSTGWQLAHYTDGRPAAGVLATNGLWWRYTSTLSNFNRGRAAALTRLLLCDDYLTRPVSFDSAVAIVDDAGAEEALRNNPYCIGCHASLDPTAASLFGFWVANEYNGDEMSNYHAEREPLGVASLEVSPEHFGRPVSGLAELGLLIADDPRFARCSAQSMAELLWRREVTVQDFDRVEALRQAYLAGGERLKPLIAAITDSPVYRAGALTEAASEADLAREAEVRLLNSTLLRSTLVELLGVTWTQDGFDLLDNDTVGFRLMGGGVDGEQVTRPQATPNLTWALSLQRATEAAAALATGELGRSGSLLDGVDSSMDPSDGAFQAQIDLLSWRLLGVRATQEEHDELVALWESVNTREGPNEAWRAVLVATMSDPRFGSY